MNDHEQQLRERREALVQAVNRHDAQAVIAFIHPSFVAKTKWGFTAGYKQMVPVLEQLFAPGSDYKETVEIETIEVSDDSATVVTRRGEQMERGAVQNKPRVKRPLIFLAGLFSLMAILQINDVGRGREGAVGTLVMYAVASVACLCWEFHMRRSVGRVRRYQETWRIVDGRWMVVEEREL